ncbi:Binding-protein-dependent transport systems inner membrane component [Paracholeplasma brassicae]|uniref:Binding-protein-dependent transport systems inner membrane component n=1 Tax=Acholeplasma brassicae TaxID=61635 RepID=U4KST2_9MOLU|nr:sugar ABC transporter permease [Paracholeplasma brassicae]CCV65484.1 Binding-protein-dependent transport systems inner membrane component [Paracholeplasma brassicae]
MIKVKKLLNQVMSLLSKGIKKLTNNRLISYQNNQLVFFKKINVRVTNKKREMFYGYVFISIWLVGFLFLTVYPLVMSFIFSLNKVTITGAKGIQMTFSGFQNYIDIFTSDLDFVDYLWAFLGQIVLYVPIILIISMVISILLNQKIKLRGFFRSVFFLPVIIASGPVINELLKQGAGTIPLLEETGIVETLSKTLPAFMANPIALLFDEMIIVLWFSGVQIVLFLAGLQKISTEIYEAAQIDGASPWESFWKITLPSLKSIILVSAVYTIVMLATFSNNSIIGHIQKVMFDTTKGYGYSSALAWVYFVVIALLLGVVAFLLKNPKEKKIKKGVKRYATK